MHLNLKQTQKFKGVELQNSTITDEEIYLLSKLIFKQSQKLHMVK